MTDRWFKVVRPDLSSFADESFRYQIGGVRRAPQPYGFELRTGKREPRVICRSGLLHASPSPPEAARYGRWPYRLLLVDPEGEPYARQRDKAGFLRLRVVEERPVAECFGPSGELVLRILRLAETMTQEQAKLLAVVGDVAWDVAWNVAWNAAWAATGYAAWDAAWVAATCHLIGTHGYTQEHYDTLMAPWVSVFGENWADE